MAERKKTAMVPVPQDFDIATRQVAYETGMDRKEVITTFINKIMELEQQKTTKGVGELAKDVRTATNAPLSWADVFMARSLQEEERARRQDDRMNLLVQMYMMQMLSDVGGKKDEGKEAMMKYLFESQDKNMDRLIEVMLSRNTDEQQSLINVFAEQQNEQQRQQQEFMERVAQVVDKLSDRIGSVINEISRGGGGSRDTAESILNQLDEVAKLQEKLDSWIDRWAEKKGLAPSEVKEEAGIDKMMKVVDTIKSRFLDPLLGSAPSPPPPREMVELQSKKIKDLGEKAKKKRESGEEIKE